MRGRRNRKKTIRCGVPDGTTGEVKSGPLRGELGGGSDVSGRNKERQAFSFTDTAQSPV